MRKKDFLLVTIVAVMLMSTCGGGGGPACPGKLYNAPSLYVLGNYVYASFYSKTKSLNPGDASCPTNTNPYDLSFAKSTDGGNTWTSTIVKAAISTTADPTEMFSQTISADPSNTNRIYISYIDSSHNLFCAASSDGGRTWSSSRVETVQHMTAVGHALSTDASGSVYILYTALDVTNPGAPTATLKSAKSTDFGVTWTLATADPAIGTGFYPSLAIDSSNIVYACYYYRQTFGGLRCISSANGVTWGSPINVKIDNTLSGVFSSVAVAPGAVYVAFYNPGSYTVLPGGGIVENKNGTLQLMQSVNSGISYSGLVTVDSNTYTGRAPSMAVNANFVYIAYGLLQDEGAPDMRLKFASSINSGAAFTVRSAELGTGVAITDNVYGPNYLSSSLKYSTSNGIGKLYLMLVDDGGSTLVFQTSSDNGSTWGSKNLSL
ncbi:MAG: sialidase family protein [bacterium]